MKVQHRSETCDLRLFARSALFTVQPLFLSSIVWTGHSSSLEKKYTMTREIVRSAERSRRPTWRSDAACLYLFLCIVCNQPVLLVFTLTQVCIVCCGLYCVMWSVFTAPCAENQAQRFVVLSIV